MKSVEESGDSAKEILEQEERILHIWNQVTRQRKVNRKLGEVMKKAGYSGTPTPTPPPHGRGAKGRGYEV